MFTVFNFKVVILSVSRNYLLLCCLHLLTYVTYLWVCSMLCTRVERWGGVELCVHWQRVATVDERTHDVVHIGLYLVPMFCVWCALLRICYGHDRIIDGRPTMSYSGNSTFSTFIYHSLPFFAILRLATPNIQLVVQL